MNVATIQESPRSRGNTERALHAFETPLHDAGHEVDRVDVVEHAVDGCLACSACHSVRHAPGCVQNDDGNRMVVYASPLYIT